MMDETVLPLIKKEHPDTSILRTCVLKIFGKTESYCDQALSEFIKSEPEIAFAFLPRYPEITLKLTMRGTDKKYIEKKLRAAERKVTRILGDIIFGKDEETLELVVGNLLRSTDVNPVGSRILHGWTYHPQAHEHPRQLRLSGTLPGCIQRQGKKRSSQSTCNHTQPLRCSEQGNRRIHGKGD